MPFNLNDYLRTMEKTLRQYERQLDTSWRKRLAQLEVLNREVRGIMMDTLASVPPERRNTVRGKLQLRKRLERVYVGWAKRADRIFDIPRVKGPKGKGDTLTAEAARQRAAVSLGLQEPSRKDADRPPTGNAFAGSALKANQLIVDFMQEEFGDQLPTPKQLANALAETVGETNQAYIENLSRNLADMVSKHGNELGDRIRSPRPEAGRAGPEGAVGGFTTDAGGKGNRNNIELSHSTHGRATLRDTTLRAHEKAKRFAVFDLDRDRTVMMTREQVRRELAGDQPAIGPRRKVHIVPLPNDPKITREMGELSDD